MKVLILYIVKYIYKDKYKLIHDRLINESNQISISNHSNQGLLVKLLISGEDHRFKYHVGFDIYAILRAVKNKIIYKRKEGASTIEQQLVRVVTNDFNKTFKRKFQEIILASIISKIVPKSSIPTIYLSLAYYGTDYKNLNDILEKFKVENIDNITLDTAAEIVSRIKYPEPSVISEKRLKQIENRKQHLINLYNKHANRKLIRIYG